MWSPVLKAFLLLSLHLLLATGQEIKNGEKGSEIVLMPRQRVETEVVWKRGINKVAEWEKGNEVHVYPAYKARFKLEPSGKLTIRNLMKEDEGDYSVDVYLPEDNRYITENFRLNVFSSLKEPSVTCTHENGFVILTCDENSSAAVEYNWKNSNGGLVFPTDIYMLQNSNTVLNVSLEKEPPKELVCVVQNPVSEKNKSISISKCLRPSGETSGTPATAPGEEEGEAGEGSVSTQGTAGDSTLRSQAEVGTLAEAEDTAEEPERWRTWMIVSMTVIALLVVGVSAALYFTGGGKVAKKKNNVKPNQDVHKTADEYVNVGDERTKESEEERLARTNSADEQKALLSSNQQEGNHPVLNSEPSCSSPGEAQDATDAASEQSHEEKAKPEVESSSGTATENQTILPTSQEKDENAHSGHMDEPKNEKSSDAEPTGDGPK